MKRNETIDNLKAFAIICVVIGHCIQFGSGSEFIKNGFFWDNLLYKFIYSFHMPLFMLISGYLFFYSVENKSFNETLLNKFKTLIIPVFSWGIICTFLKINTLTDSSLIDIIKHYINWSYSNLWFLWAIFFNSILVSIVHYYLKDKILYYILFFIICFFIGDSYNFALYKFMYPYFICGYLFNKNKMQKLISNNYIFTPGVVFLILLFSFNREGYIYITGIQLTTENFSEQLSIDMYRFLIGFVGSGLFILIFSRIKCQNCYINAIFSYIGKKTLGIYVISFYINNFLLKQITSNINGFNIIVTLLESILIILVCLFIIRVIELSPISSKLLLGK